MVSTHGAARSPAKRAAKLSPEERRAQLLGCAVTAFARQGLASANHADVAMEAGVAVPTVFSYFPSREALLEAVLNEVERVIFENAGAAAGQHEKLADQMRAVLCQYADFFDIDPRFGRLWVNWSTSFQESSWPLYQRVINRTFDLHRQLIDAAKKRGEALAGLVDAEMSACQYMGASTVIVQMKLQQFSSDQIEQYIAVVLHGALHQS